MPIVPTSKVMPVMKADFHKRFATWNRLEPRCRSADFADGLAARVADPLWLLGRQWQLGEFAGADAGTPVRADLEYRASPLSHVRLGPNEVLPLEGAPPVETLVERERLQVSSGKALLEYRMRVRAGERLERELRRQDAATASDAIRELRRKFPLRLPEEGKDRVDRATRRYVELMAGRVADGVDVLAAAPAGVPANLAAISNQVALANALQALRDWHAQLFTQPASTNSAWVADRLAYSFNLTAPEGDPALPIDLSAAHYRNGELDWHSVSLAAAPPAAGESTKSAFLPTGLAFGGMPNRRWWAFEDARIDLGGMDASSTDLAKLALVEFALVYADDWFMYPLVVPAGSVTRIASLVVTDSFGRTTLIPRGRTPGTTPRDRWEMFTLTPLAPSNDPQPKTVTPGVLGQEILFVPPAIGFREESEPLEVVRFARDEGANKVWGIERTITNALGDGVGGPGAHRERIELRLEAAGNPPPTQTGSDALLPEERNLIRYRIQTYVPHNWVPFAPVHVRGSASSIRLRRAAMLLNEDSREAEAIPGLTRLLMGDGTQNDRGPVWLNEEAVLRSGLSVQLTRQRVRWVDGKTYVWLGRGVKMGRGEASSGLRFDVVEQPAA